MKITFDWLKDHLKTNLKEKNLLEQLTNIGLEVESVESLSSDNQLFKVAKIIKTEKHPNADRLKVCDVNVGEKELKKVCFVLNLIFFSLDAINLPKPEAARSLAIPFTPRQSGRLGVIDKSIRLDFDFEK